VALVESCQDVNIILSAYAQLQRIIAHSFIPRSKAGFISEGAISKHMTESIHLILSTTGRNEEKFKSLPKQATKQ